MLFVNLWTGLRAAAVAAGVVALLAGTYASTTTHDANVGESISGSLQPAGSFLVHEVPEAGATSLLETYRAQGGIRFVRYEIPDESDEALRVTGMRLIGCMSKARTRNPNTLGDACFPQETYAPINTVVLGPANSAAAADPGLVEEGKVGLLLFKAKTAHAAEVADTDARPDSRLGGNMPGLVVPKGGRVAEHFGLHATNTSVIAFLDFSDLSRRGQSRVRAAAARFAPAAQTGDGTLPTGYAQQRSFANAVALVGAIIVTAIVLFGGAAVTLGHRRTRRTLIDIGAGARFRRRLAMRWIATPALCFVACVPLTLLSTSIAGWNAPGSPGYMWLLPSAAGLVSTGFLAVMFLRVPARATE